MWGEWRVSRAKVRFSRKFPAWRVTVKCFQIEAIDVGRWLIASDRLADRDRFRAMVDLGVALRCRFDGTGAAEDLDDAIAVGRAGKAWQGETFVQGKFVSPAWTAPWVVLRDHPNLSRIIPGGSPRNTVGAAAISLNLSEVAIHGTSANMRRSVGTAASYGCIRMYNEDVVDLYHRVEVGTPVVAIP